MLRSRWLASLFALAGCWTAASSIHAAVIYSQDWEAGTNGQSILDAPYSFTGNVNGAFLVTNTTPLGTDLAVNARAVADGGGANGSAYVGIAAPTGTAGTAYVLTSQINIIPGGNGNNSGVGLAKSEKGAPFNNTGAFIVSDRVAGLTVLGFDCRGIRSGVEATDAFYFSAAESAPFFNVNVNLTIKLDIDTNTAVATFDNGVDTPLTHSFVGGNTFAGINRFVIQQFGAGMYVDNVLIQEALSAIPGDFDSDGDVDGADFVAWQTNFPAASGATLAQGDADGDGDVDGADFVVWQTHFPFTPGPGASPVPEPGALLLMTFGASASCILVRRKR